MGEKLDLKLETMLTDSKESTAENLVSVIVTVHPGTDNGIITAAGLDIVHFYDNISAVSGSIRLKDLEKLEAIAQVEKIELDGQMQATTE